MSKETDPFLRTVPPVQTLEATALPPQEMVRNTEVVEMSVQTDHIDMPEDYLPLRPIHGDGPRECTCGAKDYQEDTIRSSSSSPPVARAPSRSSLSSANQGDVCRICHCEAEPNAPLISPCACLGSLKYVHQACLQQWIKSSDTKSCELCKYDFQMTTRIKPFRKWKKLEMTTVERRKIMCSVTFHIIAITCVIWSLYVLIDRTTEEIRTGKLEWPFWTKLIVVAIGFTGGLVFMYVQCKMYVQLCRRWRAYNRVIYIQDSPLAPPRLPQADEAETRFVNGTGNRDLGTISEVHTSTT